MTLFRVWWVRQGSSDPFVSLLPQERYVYWTLALGAYSTALPGLAHCGRAALQEATALPDDDFRAVIAALEGRDVLWADATKRIWYLPAVLDAACPQGPNNVGPWRKALDELPDGDLKARIDEHVRAFLVRYGELNPARLRKDDPAPNPAAYILAWDPKWRPPDPSRKRTEPLPDGLATHHEGVPRGLPQGRGMGTGWGQGQERESGSEQERDPQGDRKVGKEGFGKPSEGNLDPAKGRSGRRRAGGLTPTAAVFQGGPFECQCGQVVVEMADRRRFNLDGSLHAHAGLSPQTHGRLQ
jgi:hypothetical protein